MDGTGFALEALKFGINFNIGGVRMLLSEKIKNILLAPFAISRIMKRCWQPGLVGLLLFAVGAWQHVGWLKVAGVVIAAPVIWVYAVLTLIYFPFILFDKIRRTLKNNA
jgi:hypothetical protein